MAQVCQPLAISPPNEVWAAKSRSVCMRCGSYWRAKVEDLGLGHGIAAEIGLLAEPEIFEITESHRAALKAATTRRKAWPALARRL